MANRVDDRDDDPMDAIERREALERRADALWDARVAATLPALEQLAEQARAAEDDRCENCGRRRETIAVGLCRRCADDINRIDR